MKYDINNYINNLPKTQSKTYEFDGIPSGDGESFCWDVNKETYISIKGEQPNKFDKSESHKGLYRIYPNDFYGFDRPKCRIKISIEIIKD